MIPKLPTDNLYKFIALFGLVLFCFGHYSKIRMQWENYRTVATNNAEIVYNNKMQDSLRKMLTELKNGPVEINVLVAGKLCQSKKDAMVLVQERILQLEEDAKRLEITQTELKCDSDFISKLWISLNFIIGFGLLMIITGFFLWYFKLQKYLDKQVKNHREEKN